MSSSCTSVRTLLSFDGTIATTRANEHPNNLLTRKREDGKATTTKIIEVIKRSILHATHSRNGYEGIMIQFVICQN